MMKLFISGLPSPSSLSTTCNKKDDNLDEGKYLQRPLHFKVFLPLTVILYCII